MPTKRENIEKWSNTYQILKYYVDFCFRFYFPTTISGLENIPKGKTVIFAPNHQNALIDALAILSVKTWQPVFLARADIFQKPLISKILTFLKIMPVYRIRDGYGSLHKNDEVFNKTVDVLKNQNGLCLMPEGNHGDKKRLRLPLKKGLARIAFQAEEACKGTLDIHVVPVGLDYTHYSRVGSPLHIRFGPPIRVKPMLSAYKKNPATAYKELLDLVAQGIKNEIINVFIFSKNHNYILFGVKVRTRMRASQIFTDFKQKSVKILLFFLILLRRIIRIPFFICNAK
ncbi:MAG TPA: 1-acyl-sn-glycerol-3-phosphate acyltransferase [Tenuifilaceae bacterium]|nr:1-acyl-sn-glycerol-3-phosphate acyltransferase [Tenuifilaceae bacterium]